MNSKYIYWSMIGLAATFPIVTTLFFEHTQEVSRVSSMMLYLWGILIGAWIRMEVQTELEERKTS